MSWRKTCQKAQPSVEENGHSNGYDADYDVTRPKSKNTNLQDLVYDLNLKTVQVNYIV